MDSTDLQQVNGEVAKLLEENVVREDDEIVFTDTAISLIHEIAEKCRNIPIVHKNQDKADEYAQGLTAEQAYLDMLCKIAGAPTKFHMECTVWMLLPVVSKKLKEREERLCKD